ncbi:MAG: VWA domain-containing protein [Deltaproteobacteria bacterium]|nr:VWA domain-containing protein [Deltaproteobacteria bacterium]
MSLWWQSLLQWCWEKLEFATPELLWAAFLSPVALMLLHAWDRFRRRALTSRLGELPVIGRVIASASPGRRLAKDLLVGFGLGLVFFALARPQLEGKRRQELHGLDLVVAVDVSKSMLVEDVGKTADMEARNLEPNRLHRARELARALIEELPGDRIAPMVFADGATHLPLTEDHQVAGRFLTDLGPSDLPPGSNLAAVLRVGLCVLRPDLKEQCKKVLRRGHGGDPLPGESDSPRNRRRRERDEDDDAPMVQEVERGKAMVIFTDGGDVDEEVLRAVAKNHEFGVATFLVGIGSEQGGVVHEVDPFTGKRTAEVKKTKAGATVTSRRDDAGMRAIAEAGGDDKRYLVANESGEVVPLPIVEALRNVSRGVASKQVKQAREIFQPFLFIGFMLLIVEAAISTRRRRPYPEAR